MGMEFPWKSLRDREKGPNLQVGMLLFAIVIYGVCEISDGYMPLKGLPPLGERIGNIKKSVDPDDFCFAVLGDSHNDKKVFPAVVDRIDKDPEISFAIHTGDMVKKPRDVFYRDFLETIKAGLHKPILVVPGNHDVVGEEDDSQYERVFGPTRYAFRIGDSLLVMADALKLSSAEEYNWLRDALNQNQSKNTMVFTHLPLYDPRGKDEHHCFKERIASGLIDIFDEYRVNHIFTGHLHGYWAGKWGGIPYTISAGAGARFHSKDPAHAFHHYVKVRVRDARVEEEVVPVNITLLSKAINVVSAYARNESPKSIILAVIVVLGLFLFRCEWRRRRLSEDRR